MMMTSSNLRHACALAAVVALVASAQDARAQGDASAEAKAAAQKKMADLNSDTVESAMRMIEGSARSMGYEVKP